MPTTYDKLTGLPGFQHEDAEVEEASDSDDRQSFAAHIDGKMMESFRKGLHRATEEEMRNAALSLAASAGGTSDEVVARAAAYLAFLKGPAQ